jgi:hypothetical protein
MAEQRQRQLHDDYVKFVEGYVGLLTGLGPERMAVLLSDFSKLDIVKVARPTGAHDPGRAGRIWKAWKDAPDRMKKAAVIAVLPRNATPTNIDAAMRLAQREDKRRRASNHQGPTEEITIPVDDDAIAALDACAFTSPVVHMRVYEGGRIIHYIDAVEIWDPITKALKDLEDDKG